MKCNKPLSIFFITGEPSGDILGAHLMDAILKLQTNVEFQGVLGPKMRKHKSRCIVPMEAIVTMGFKNILFSLRQFYQIFVQVRQSIITSKPDVVVCIDSPVFNLRLAKSLRKHKFSGKIVQYVCPSVWAWGRGRIHTLVQNYNTLLSILPFEKEIFQKTTLKTHYIGHPLTSIISSYNYCTEWKLSRASPVISIFPGSRRQEIILNLRKQFLAALRVSQNIPIAISIATGDLKALIQDIVFSTPRTESTQVFFVPETYRYELMRITKVAIATSGTITLELALHQVPTVITYGIQKFDQFLAKYIFQIRMPFYTLPNVISKAQVFPELIGPHFTVSNTSNALQRSLTPLYAEECRLKCTKIWDLLQTMDANSEAAKAILDF
ncbi:MAG: lipid-A-disaccharide synthase [Chlamydiales bacterium]